MIRAPLSELREGDRVLPPDLARYFNVVLRLTKGTRVRFFDKQTRLEADGEILSVSPSEIHVRVSAPEPGRVVTDRELVLVYALAKGDKVDDVVRDATELGATRVVIAESERSVVRLDDKKAEARRARWSAIAEQAARQSGRVDPPKVEGPFPLARALDVAASEGAIKVLLAPNAEARLRDVLTLGLGRDEAAPITLAIGPEGGFSPAEITVAEGLGYAAVSFGKSVLRTETAAVAALSAVRLLAL